MSHVGRPQGHYRPENLGLYGGTAATHGLESHPSVPVRQRFGFTPAYPPEVSYHQECAYACVPRWAIENDQISTLQTWLTNDAAKVDRSILLDLLKTCVYRDVKVMAQLILTVDISPPLDVSIVLGDCVRDMHRSQIVTALELGAGFGDIHPDDMWRVFSAEEGDVAQLFLEKGLNPDLELKRRDSKKGGHLKKPAALLCAACMRSDTIVLEALIKAGADMRVFRRQASRGLQRQHSSNPGLFEPTISTPMSVAAFLAPNLHCLQFLLEKKYVQPDVDELNELFLQNLCLPPSEYLPSWLSCFRRETKMGTPLSSSTLADLVSVEPQCEARIHDSRLDCLEMLLNHGLDPNAICRSDSSWALPMLTFAAEAGNIKIIQLLLRKGALIDSRQFWQGTALIHTLYCAERNMFLTNFECQLEAAMYLVHAGADVAPGDETAATAIHIAILLGSSQVLNRLFEAMRQGHRPPKYKHMDTPQYIEWMINRGYMGTATALIQALECAKPDLVQVLLDNGADVHQSDRLGRTALMLAARQLPRFAGQPETQGSGCARSDAEEICVKLLLHGADPHKSDGANHNAYHYAGDEACRFAELVEKARLRLCAAEDDGTAAGDDDTAAGDDDTAAGDDDTAAGDDDTAAGDDDTAVGDDDTAVGDDDTAAGDDDTQLDVEKAQETMVEGGSSSSMPRNRGSSREVVDSTAKRRRVD